MGTFIFFAKFLSKKERWKRAVGAACCAIPRLRSSACPTLRDGALPRPKHEGVRRAPLAGPKYSRAGKSGHFAALDPIGALIGTPDIGLGDRSVVAIGEVVRRAQVEGR